MLETKKILIWLSGALLMSGAWQFEIVLIRSGHNESYALPFFVINFGDPVTWSIIWLSTIILSYIVFVIATKIEWNKNKIEEIISFLKNKWNILSLLLLIIGVWELLVLHLNMIGSNPYSPLFTKLNIIEKMEWTKRIEFNPILQPSFWGDIWIIMIVLSYVILILKE